MPDPLHADHQESPDGASATQWHVRDPEVHFAALAAELGIIKPGDRLDDVQMEFAYGVVDLCATIGDRYGDKAYGNAGDHIRSVYGPV